MTCQVCEEIKEQINRAKTITLARVLSQHLLEHKLLEHNNHRRGLPWSNWPQVGVCLHCVGERKN